MRKEVRTQLCNFVRKGIVAGCEHVGKFTQIVVAEATYRLCLFDYKAFFEILFHYCMPLKYSSVMFSPDFISTSVIDNPSAIIKLTWLPTLSLQK